MFLLCLSNPPFYQLNPFYQPNSNHPGTAHALEEDRTANALMLFFNKVSTHNIQRTYTQIVS